MGRGLLRRNGVVATALRNLTQHGRGYPFATNLSLISVPIGLLAIGTGQEVSRAFTIVYSRPEPIYVWGVVLLLGGLQVAVGIAQRRPSRERAGLYILAIAYAFYGISVMAGLGKGGLVTGPVFVVLAGSCLQRAHIILADAQHNLQVNIAINAEDESPGQDNGHVRSD